MTKWNNRWLWLNISPLSIIAIIFLLFLACSFLFLKIYCLLFWAPLCFSIFFASQFRFLFVCVCVFFFSISFLGPWLSIFFCLLQWAPLFHDIWVVFHFWLLSFMIIFFFLFLVPLFHDYFSFYYNLVICFVILACEADKCKSCKVVFSWICHDCASLSINFLCNTWTWIPPLSTITFIYFYNIFFDMSTSKACHEVSNFPIKWDMKGLKTLGMTFKSLQVSIKGVCERSIMGLGWTFQINLVNMWKYINQNKRVVYAFGTKFGHGFT
jgi:hypothetical protein